LVPSLPCRLSPLWYLKYRSPDGARFLDRVGEDFLIGQWSLLSFARPQWVSLRSGLFAGLAFTESNLVHAFNVGIEKARSV
jgi:hypothetical protein